MEAPQFIEGRMSQNVSVAISLGLMVGIARVSGSGKSSLINDTLVPKLKEILKKNLYMMKAMKK